MRPLSVLMPVTRLMDAAVTDVVAITTGVDPGKKGGNYVA